ncbi:hypothetical protein EVAR_51346_1 [Eumeta japonica]|uniref:Uncharacterized protein n=1 Tax=Eumeta variegata TaxID=151549 RepID=A0A4C1XZW4_EUMVA|nr:hypothetical protein EVAR_51346_1 [Eumeta japonica]
MRRAGPESRELVVEWPAVRGAACELKRATPRPGTPLRAASCSAYENGDTIPADKRMDSINSGRSVLELSEYAKLGQVGPRRPGPPRAARPAAYRCCLAVSAANPRDCRYLI